MQLPATFYSPVPATPLPEPVLVAKSDAVAHLIGLPPGWSKDAAWIERLSGNALAATPAPVAAVYSGHQFGVWAGQLGDGRAVSIGALAAPAADGLQYELQLKGAGKTPYSRGGDGRAVLRSSIREFLCSEAMAGLGISTTRALCIVGSAQPVIRETVETAAVVTRVAQSFVRFGSFEHWYQRDAADELETLANFVISHFYPDIKDASNRYAALLGAVTIRTATLIAQWQAVGFCHGVMNTDNMSILGQTLDYGPFGFMEAFDANYICNHTDAAGRYAYAMQPQVAHWNLYALGQALLPLIGSTELAQLELARFKPAYEETMTALMCAKLGVTVGPKVGPVIDGLFKTLQAGHPDFTLFFRRLCGLKRNGGGDGPVRDLFVEPEVFDTWAVAYRALLQDETASDADRALAMRRANPKFVLRNYLAENAIRAAQVGDFSEIERLLYILSRPYDEQPEYEQYAALPPDWANGLEVSCSS